jgi:hypothetical protein
MLITNLFHLIAVRGYSHDTIVAMLGTVDAVEDEFIIIETSCVIHVTMAIDTAH